MTTIYPFSSAEPLTAGQVGGKAMSLISMTRAGLPVPTGLVLSVDFFAPWIKHIQASPEWKTMQKASQELPGLAAQALQALCRTLPFDRRQQEEFERALEAFRANSPVALFAVRSSAPEEDLESASFAGGYETTLGVRVEDLEAAIRHSFASGLDERVFLYKRAHGFPTDQIRMAVIVQQQVDADCAGVAFSLNPLNNCYDEAVISANHGLGETVVAGTVEPDTFVVDKLNRKIIDTRCGSKELVTRLNPEGGTKQTAHVNDNQTCLTSAQVLRIVIMLEQVEASYKMPVDIEWAMAGDALLLLQARPITTYLPLPEEMLTKPGEPKTLYADATLIEQGKQEPLSVLGTEFLGHILSEMTGPLGSDVTGLDGIAFTAGGRYYLNLSNSIKLMGVKSPMAPGSMGDASVVGILESINLKQYIPRKLPKKLVSTRSSMLFRMLPTLISAMGIYRRPDRFMQKYMAAYPRQLVRMKEFTRQELSLGKLVTELTSIVHFFSVEYGMPMFLIPQFVENQLKRMFGKDDGQVKDKLVSLGIALPGSKPARMGQMMYQLASFEDIQSKDSAEFLVGLREKTLKPEFLKLWERFMLEFGFRCPGEVDVATPRPNEQPGLLFEQLKGISLAEGSGSVFEEARLKREAAYKFLKGIAIQKGKGTVKSFEAGYRILLSFGGQGKETSKHYIVMVVDAFRKRALQVGQSLVEAGRLDVAEQIFDLRIADIEQGQDDPALDLRLLAQERTRLLKRIKQSHLVARVIDSRGKIFQPPSGPAKAGELSGVPISPGIVQGRVKVLTQVNEKRLLPGEILVARATDPGWTPLFINAAGIILEIGGALQHGAVVAREYGLPCVSGVVGATELLQDGQLVEVDGSRGVVRMVEEG
jgi:phosphoenolpyruvate synthase/pyruvate phosphate dikinase